MDALSAGTVVGARYTVVQVLGQGGMAVVYEVMNHQLGTPCALKVLTLTARSIRQRLQREGQVQARLQHPNIVSVFDVIDVDGCPGLLMELVRGPPLDVLLAEQRLTFEQCDALARGIFAGMEAAHEAGLIHRDLKPANILCSIANGQLIPKIADFGLAKIVGDESGAAAPSATKSGTTMGTPSYMAPEQIRAANKVDRRADLFSLGAILYEMVCGRKAFENDDLLDLFTAVAAGRYTPPRALRPDLPERMERAIVAALAPNREERVRDVEALAAVWNGDREDWTKEIDAGELPATGPWDAALLSRYRSVTSSGNSGELAPSGPSGGQVLTPMSPSTRRDPISGVTYTEEVLPQAPRPPAVVHARAGGSARRSLFLLALGGMGLGAGALSVLAALLLLWLGPSLGGALAGAPPGPPPGPVPPPAPAAAPAPEAPSAGPAVEGSPAPEGTPPAPPSAPDPAPIAPAPVVVRPAAPAPAPVEPVAPVPADPAPAPEPAPASAPATTVPVTVRGDARRVFLLDARGNHPVPADLAPGTYTIQAFFGDEGSVTSGTITLALGRPATVLCSAQMRTCKAP